MEVGHLLVTPLGDTAITTHLDEVHVRHVGHHEDDREGREEEEVEYRVGGSRRLKERSVCQVPEKGTNKIKKLKDLAVVIPTLLQIQ